MSKVIMVMGYPASGKSTITKKLAQEGYTILNRDKEGGKIADLLPRLESLILQKKDIILDNTFATGDDRKPFIEISKKLKAEIECMYLTASIEDAQFNACYRMMERYGKILTPQEISASKDPNMFPVAVLFSYRKRLEEPSTSEGFLHVIPIKFERCFPVDWTNKAILLDYDDTLRTTTGDNKWPVFSNEVSILPHRTEILKHYKERGYILLGVSNQSGISKNHPTEEQAISCFERTNELLGQKIDYRYCPHAPNPISCYCRKPLPGMAVYFFYKYKLDPKQCIMVGDMTSDKTFASRSHIKYIDAEDFFK